MRTDHGGKASAARRVLEGPQNVARFVHGLWNKRDQLPAELQVLVRYINGAPGIVLTVGGVVFSTFVLRIAHSNGVPRIVEISATRNPDKLAQLQSALATNETLTVHPR